MSKQFESIRQWFTQNIRTVLPADEVHARYHSQHPRGVFLKTLPADASMLDAGAGDGGLEMLRNWPAPARPDLKLFAYSLDKGDNFDNYDGYELGNWDEHPPEFSGMKFDAIYSSHFIEHIKSAEAFIRWGASRLKPGGRFYVEWPSHESQFCPSMQELSSIGFGRITANFHDDLTHITLPATEDVVRYLGDSGLIVDAQGVIRMPVFETELLANYRDTEDLVALQFAYWLRTGWCQYVTAHMPEAGVD